MAVGFLLWDTDTKCHNGGPYPYKQQLLAGTDDLLTQFSSAMKAAGLGHCFYYSLTKNFFLNVH